LVRKRETRLQREQQTNNSWSVRDPRTYARDVGWDYYGTQGALWSSDRANSISVAGKTLHWHSVLKVYMGSKKIFD